VPDAVPLSKDFPVDDHALVLRRDHPQLFVTLLPRDERPSPDPRRLSASRIRPGGMGNWNSLTPTAWRCSAPC